MSEGSDSQPYLSTRELVSCVNERGYVTPQDVSESRRRENVLRTQLRELARQGWLVEFSQDLFRLSDMARQFLTQSSEITSRPGELDRITDVSEIDAGSIKQLNLDLYESETQQYGLVEDSPQKTYRRILNVKESKLDRLIREFPTSEPLCVQCAHWARAISGKHFFPDANHRTAMASLSALLNLNGIDVQDWPGEDIDRTVLKAKFARIFLVDVRFDTLWKRDELFQVWHRHFRNVFYDIEEERYRSLSRGQLRRSLNAAREER